MVENDLKTLTSSIDELLAKTKIDDITPESNNDFKELEEGYYLCSVDKSEIKESKSSGQPMIAFTFTVLEDGNAITTDESGNVIFTKIKSSKNRKVFKYYVLKDESSVKRFVSDMLKFEGKEEGVPLLEKEYFTSSELLTDALEILIGSNIYLQVSVREKEDGTKSTWQNLISRKRAKLLELPS